MAPRKVTKFPPVPKSAELSNWLEEHVAAPSHLEHESRLLWFSRLPHPDQDPEGVVNFRLWRFTGGVSLLDLGLRRRVVLRLKYEMIPIPMPDWFYPR